MTITATNSTLVNVAAKLSTFSSLEINKFLDEVSPTCNGTNLCSNYLTDGVVSTWKYLYDNQKEFARKDWNTLVQFGKLNENVKAYIVKFSDNSTAKTLIEFCADLPKAHDGKIFLDYVNDANNFTVVKKMVSHKLTAEEFEEVGEEYQIETSLVGLAKTWVDRSDKIVELKQNGEDGRFYGRRAVVALLNNSLNLGIAGIDQSQYKVFNEVQLWVDKTKDQYMIADILLIKYKADNTTIDDVIICESKLSEDTDYTKRQKQGWRLIHEGKALEVKATKRNILIDGTDGNLQLTAGTSKLSINTEKTKRIYDSGDKNGRFNISTIPVTNYSSYTAKN